MQVKASTSYSFDPSHNHQHSHIDNHFNSNNHYRFLLHYLWPQFRHGGAVRGDVFLSRRYGFSLWRQSGTRRSSNEIQTSVSIDYDHTINIIQSDAPIENPSVETRTTQPIIMLLLSPLLLWNSSPAVPDYGANVLQANLTGDLVIIAGPADFPTFFLSIHQFNHG